MKICFPVEVADGLNSAVAADLRAARHWLLLDSATLEHQLQAAGDGHCSSLPGGIDALFFIDGLGRGMFNTLQQNGVRVFACPSGTVRQALFAFSTGRVQQVHEAGCCGGGHDHHGGQGSGCGGHGSGQGCCGGH